MDAYGRCQVIGLLLAAVLGVGLSRLRGLGVWRPLAALAFGIAGALLGGRLAKALGDLPAVAQDPALLFQFSFKGFDLVGAVVGAAMAAGVAARRLSLQVLDLADSAAPGLGFAIAVQRWGCWCAGCCFGRPTSLPWAVSVEPFGDAHNAQMAAGQAELFGSPLPIHPYPLYELGMGLVVGLVCFLVWRRCRPGAAIGTFLALFFALKFAATFTRFPDAAGDPPWVHLGLYGLLAAAGAWLIWRRARTTV
jgi:phosphatidylglycerol:prolipoprotein diacylglycerol transferase